jgi:acetylornithine deacetylase
MSIQIPPSCQSLLQAMVGYDSINAGISGQPDAELALAQYLEGLAQGLGLTTQRLPMGGQSFNLLLSHQVATNAPWLLFESHLDTVGVEGMSIDPFAGEIKAGRLYGRGACDTKGTGAAMLWALKEYLAGSSQPNNIALLYTLDEEGLKAGIRAFAREHLPTLRWRPAGAIIGEPTQLKLIVAHNGVVRWRIRTHGRAAHSSDPGQGRSAISMMVKVIQALEARYIPTLTTTHPLTGKAQGSINVIRGGSHINIIPDQCEIQVDRRIVPGEDPEQVLPTVERLLDELRQADDQLRVSQAEPDIVDYPLDPRGSEQFANFVGRVLERMGLPAGPLGVGYGTNGSNLGRIGIPTVVLGPGDIAQAHTRDEWLDLEQLRQGVSVYHQLMCSPFRRD